MRLFLRTSSLFLLLITSSLTSQVQGAPLYKNPHAPLAARVNDLYKRLTEKEKLSLLSGTAFTTNPIPRLGIPAMSMADGAQGVRGGDTGTLGSATLFPAPVTEASTWDTNLINRIGQAIGEEALNKGTGAQILLGPAVNIDRSPLNGRDGEYFSEDPYLTSQLAVAYILGMQSTGCGACIKHFVCNNEEQDQQTVDVRVGERALREIYLPAFKAGVKQGHVWSIMAAYNKVNGYHMTANRYLLTDVLDKDWRFDGVAMSDWGAVHQTTGVVNAGLNLEMPGPGFLAVPNLAKALQEGLITQASIDNSVRRILRTIIRVGLLNPPRTINHSLVNSPAHQRLALESAEEGIVLLKNQEGLLPLHAAKLKSIAVIGPAAMGMQYGAQGSVSVQPFFAISPLQGITKRAGPDVAIHYATGTDPGVPIPTSVLTPTAGDGAVHGLLGEYFSNANLAGAPVVLRTDKQIAFNWDTVSPAPQIPRTNFSARWTGKLVPPLTGRYTLMLTADDGCRLFLNGKELIDNWAASDGPTETADVNLAAGQSYNLKVEYFQAAGEAYARLNWLTPAMAPYRNAVAAAAKSDVAIVCVSTLGTEGEGEDRSSMALPDHQGELIRAVAAANPHTIVILNNGAPVTMIHWLNQVPGLIEAWFPGEEGGRALAALLFGDVDPSGKLPVTFGRQRQDYPDYGHFPGVNGQVNYAEGIYVGYRWFDKRSISPSFPFGYGLSYTTFQYSHLHLSSPHLTPHGTVTAVMDVTNTGHQAGAEVAELYIHDPDPKIDKPVRALKGFARVDLLPGQTKSVSLTITPQYLAYCDVPGEEWKADAGVYDIEMGNSSRDIRLMTPLRLTATYTRPIPFMQRDPLRNLGQDLALGRPVLASSVQDIPDVGPGNAVDGSASTRWSSQFSDPQWISVDLGRPMTVARVRLDWEDAFAQAYQIQVSQNGKDWSTVYSTQKGKGGIEIIHFPPVTARWVRMYGTKRATQFGYSLYSFEVYGLHR